MATDDARIEREFWLKVILRAQAEANGRYVEKGDNPRMIRYLARKWLTHCTKSLQQVSKMAGLNSQQVQNLIQQSKEKWGHGRKQ